MLSNKRVEALWAEANNQAVRFARLIEAAAMDNAAQCMADDRLVTNEQWDARRFLWARARQVRKEAARAALGEGGEG